ncbi:MAG: barstar family protein [Bacteroidia bacterium]
MPFQLIPIDEEYNFKFYNDSWLVTLDGKRCQNKELLLNEMATIFNFPNHFGQNFDALYDSLENLENTNATYIFWLIVNPQFICSDEKNNAPLDTYCQVLRDVLEEYKTKPTSLNIIADYSFLNKIKPISIG